MEYPQGSPEDGFAQCLPLDGVPDMVKVEDIECEQEVYEGNRLGNAYRLAVYGPTGGDDPVVVVDSEYLGCYINQNDDRVEGHVGNTSFDLCNATHNYFGMEYPQGFADEGVAQCLALDGVPDMVKVDDSECEVEVYEGKRLGNAYRLAVYGPVTPTPETPAPEPITPAPETPAPEPSDSDESDDAEYLGCFVNNDEDRVEGHIQNTSFNDCDLENSYFGMEYPQGSPEDGFAQCLPLDGVPDMVKVEDIECEQEVYEGNRLGNAYRLAVYGPTGGDDPVVVVDSEYLGCYINQNDDRVEGHVGNTSFDLCNATHNYFGMEYPQGFADEGVAQCLALDGVPDMVKVDDSECEVEVYEGKRLGNAYRLAVYGPGAGVPCSPEEEQALTECVLELATTQTELNSCAESFETAESDLAAAQAALETCTSDFEDQGAQLTAAQAEIESLQAQLESCDAPGPPALTYRDFKKYVGGIEDEEECERFGGKYKKSRCKAPKEKKVKCENFASEDFCTRAAGCSFDDGQCDEAGPFSG